MFLGGGLACSGRSRLPCSRSCYVPFLGRQARWFKKNVSLRRAPVTVDTRPRVVRVMFLALRRGFVLAMARARLLRCGCGVRSVSCGTAVMPYGLGVCVGVRVRAWNGWAGVVLVAGGGGVRCAWAAVAFFMGTWRAHVCC